MVTRYVIEGDPGNTAIWERYIPYAYQSPDWQAYLSFKVPSTDSLTKRIRFLSLAQLVRQAPVGAFAECGCFEGHSTHVIATIMKECGRENPLYVFDSFAGLSAASPQDITQDPASTRLAERLRDGGAKGM